MKTSSCDSDHEFINFFSLGFMPNFRIIFRLIKLCNIFMYFIDLDIKSEDNYGTPDTIKVEEIHF